MENENYNLSRNDFQNSTCDAIKLLKLDTDFLDVTLACDDGKQVNAHKVVLSAFSSVFETILKKNAHNHPLIYLSGINHQDLEKILDFVYLGEAIVSKDEYDRFMDVAEKLKITGLIQYKDNEGTKKVYDVQKVPEEIMEDKIQLLDDFIEEDNYVAPLSKDLLVQGDISLKSQVNAAEDFSVRNYKQEQNYSMNTKHKFGCDDCKYSGTTRSNLKVHVLAKHKGVKFPCQACEYKGSTKWNTVVHMRNMHSM